MLSGFVTRDDIFISYSRQDGGLYAAGLADRLTEKRFSCFIDKLGTEPGLALPESLKKKIRSCTVFVLVATEKACASEFVEKELIEFKSTKRPIVPISFNQEFSEARWSTLVQGVSTEPEKNAAALLNGEPSPSVIAWIEKSFRYTRRNVRMRRIFLTTTALFLILAAATAVAAYLAKAYVTEARIQKHNAAEASGLARQRIHEAEDATKLADQETKLAKQADARAAAAALLAESKRREAMEFSHLATAQELATYSIENVTKDPELSILLAMHSVDATRRFGEPVSVAAEGALHRTILSSALRANLGHNPSVGAIDLDKLMDSPEPYVTGVSYSPDGRVIATVGGDKKLQLWDAETARHLRTFNGEEAFMQVSFSPDGLRLATAGDKNITVRDAKTGVEQYKLPGGIMAFSSDGKRIAITVPEHDAPVTLYDVTSGHQVLRIDNKTSIDSMAFSPDDRTLATAGKEKLTLWDLGTSQAVMTQDVSGALGSSVAFSPDGETLAAAGLGGAKVWDSRGKPLLTLSRPLSLDIGLALPGRSLVAFSPNSVYLATVSDIGAIRIVDLSTNGAEEQILRGMDSVLSMVFSPDGRHLVTASDDGMARLWDLGDRPELPLLDAETPVSFSPDGSRLAMTTSEVFDSHTGQKGPPLFDKEKLIALSPDWTRAVITTESGSQELWTMGTKRRLATLRVRDNRDVEPRAAFSKDGSLLVTIDGATARLWNGKTGGLTYKIQSDHRSYFAVAISPDGRRFATAGVDESFTIWNTTTGRELITVKAHKDGIQSLAFSPDGKWVATAGNDESAKIWNAATGSQLLSLDGHNGAVKDVAFTPSGDRVATASDDGTVKLWDARTGEELFTLTGHTSYVEHVVVSSDGKTLASNGRDSTTRLYVLEITDLVRLAKTRVTRGLSQEECRRYLHHLTCPPLPK